MYRKVPLLYRVTESFFRYRSLFLISSVIVTAIPAAVLVTRKPTYTSTGMMQVVSQDMTAILGDNNRSGGWVTPAQTNVNQFNDVMNDDSPGGFVDSALKRANLSHPINVDPRARDPRLAALRKGLTFATTSDTVFTINLVWENSAECEQIVKALEDQYIERIGEDKIRTGEKVEDFLTAEKARYAKRMHDAELQVIEFQSKNSGNPKEASGPLNDQLSILKSQMNELIVSSQSNEIRRKGFEDQLKHTPPTRVKESTETPKEDPQETHLSQLNAERNRLLMEGWLKTSTRIQGLDAQIKSLELDMAAAKADPNHAKNTNRVVVTEDNPAYQEIQSQLTEATITKNMEESQILQLRNRIGEYEARLAKLPGAEIRLADRMRDFDIIKSQHDELAKRLEQERTKKNLDKVAASATIQAIGTVYAQSTGGKGKTTIMLAVLLVFGLILGVSVTVLAEWADPTLRYASDVERRLGVPVLISLPEMDTLMMATSSSSTSDRELPGGRPLLPARDE